MGRTTALRQVPERRYTPRLPPSTVSGTSRLVGIEKPAGKALQQEARSLIARRGTG